MTLPGRTELADRSRRSRGRSIGGDGARRAISGGLTDWQGRATAPWSPGEVARLLLDAGHEVEVVALVN